MDKSLTQCEKKESIIIQYLKSILKFWLGKSPVFGFRLGSFNALFEDESKDILTSDVESTLAFLDELREEVKVFEDADGIQRLFLIEMMENGQLERWQHSYANATLDPGNVLPFSFGEFPWL